MKDYLIKNQPFFYKLITNEFHNKKIPHAFLLIGDNCQIPVTYLSMALICQSDEVACEQCEDCQRIQRGIFPDIIHYNGLEESIKKGQVENLRDEFSKSSIEGKGKIYILENIEYSTKSAMNALLKFLEEPMDGTFAILTAKNPNMVLPTIRSRCQVIELKKDNQKEIIRSLMDEGFSQEKANILSQICLHKDEALEFDEELYNYLNLQAMYFLEDLFTKRDNLIINTQTNILKKYSDKATIKLFLNFVLIGLKDMFHVKHSDHVDFCNHQEMFSGFNIDIDDIIKKISLTLETINLLDTNANVPLLMDSYMYRL